MEDLSNNFAPPNSDVAQPVNKVPLTAAAKALLALILLQLTWSALLTPNLLRLVQVGGMSLIHFLGIALLMICLAVGALLQFTRSKRAFVFFCLAAAMGGLSLLRWPFGFAVSAELLALIGAAISWRGRRPS